MQFKNNVIPKTQFQFSKLVIKDFHYSLVNAKQTMSFSETIEEWVNSLRLSKESLAHCTETFAKHGSKHFAQLHAFVDITLERLPHLTSQDLDEMGIKKIGARNTILKSINSYRAFARPLFPEEKAAFDEKNDNAIKTWKQFISLTATEKQRCIELENRLKELQQMEMELEGHKTRVQKQLDLRDLEIMQKNKLLLEKENSLAEINKKLSELSSNR